MYAEYQERCADGRAGRLPWESVRAKLVEIGAGTAVELVVFEEFAPASSRP